jgi:hypothetical protein
MSNERNSPEPNFPEFSWSALLEKLISPEFLPKGNHFLKRRKISMLLQVFFPCLRTEAYPNNSSQVTGYQKIVAEHITGR